MATYDASAKNVLAGRNFFRTKAEKEGKIGFCVENLENEKIKRGRGII